MFRGTWTHVKIPEAFVTGYTLLLQTFSAFSRRLRLDETAPQARSAESRKLTRRTRRQELERRHHDSLVIRTFEPA
jgi:hypothetical protein